MDIEDVKNNRNNDELEVKNILYSNDQLKTQINEYLNMIETNKKRIKENEKKIWVKCNHEWKRDYNVCFGDKIKYYCVKCKLLKNEYMYT
tara:strand:+ start:3219 stop:3488 length:270 start_codon:yes stop_codon:yes gene_type:complete